MHVCFFEGEGQTVVLFKYDLSSDIKFTFRFRIEYCVCHQLAYRCSCRKRLLENPYKEPGTYEHLKNTNSKDKSEKQNKKTKLVLHYTACLLVCNATKHVGHNGSL